MAAEIGVSYISIHAPLRERPRTSMLKKVRTGFQSTLPCGSDLATRYLSFRNLAISIHAPLRERHVLVTTTCMARKISIHAPLRERQNSGQRFFQSLGFQSTLPCGSDLLEGRQRAVIGLISIHAPLRERHSS